MSYLESLISKTTKIIRRWHGYHAEMNELTKSHSILRIVVQGKSFRENLVIACIDPLFISGPTEWEHSEIELKITKYKNEDVVSIIDEKNSIRIIAGSFEVKENVRL